MPTVVVRRFIAGVLDVAVFTSVAWGLTWLVSAQPVDSAITYAPYAAAETWKKILPLWMVWHHLYWVLPTWLAGGTFGKRLVGIRVVSLAADSAPHDAPTKYWRAAVRETWAKLWTVASLGMGWADAVSSDTTLHDRLVGTDVVEGAESERLDTATAWSEVTWATWFAVVGSAGVLLWSRATDGLFYRVFWMGAIHLPHEAGHLLVGLAAPGLVAVAAGTAFQFIFPGAAAVSFARRGEAAQAAGCAVWTAASLLYTADYLGDAWDRELALPMPIGGAFSEDLLDSHDFWQLLSAAKVLAYAPSLGATTRFAGWALLCGALVWLAVRALSRPAALPPEI